MCMYMCSMYVYKYCILLKVSITNNNTEDLLSLLYVLSVFLSYP